jgi:glycerol uptake facilitator-like aquaporin
MSDRNANAARGLAAEALGTWLLVTAVVGSGIMGERLAGGSIGMALFGNTVATGAMLFVLIRIFQPLSGAHFNPCVTFVFLLRGEIAPLLALAYVLVQCGTAVAGSATAHMMFDLPIVEHASHVRAGMGQLVGEGVATFTLILAILGCLAVAPGAVAPAVALTIVAGYWFTSSTSFANPAVTLARSLTDTFSGIRFVDVPGFVAAQFGGTILAAVVVGWLWPRKKKAPARIVGAGAPCDGSN